MLLPCVESDTYSTLSCSSCSTWSMNIGINFFWRLQLDNKIYFRNIKSSCCDIGSNKTLKFSLFECLESYLSLFLRDISMEDLSLLFKISFKENFVGFLFGFAENNCSSVSSTVKVDNIGNNRISMIVRAVEG